MYSTGSEYMIDIDDPNNFIRLHNANCSGMWEQKRNKFHCLNCNAEHSNTENCTHDEDSRFWGVLPFNFLNSL